ncbi:hypothetical protein B0I35DRAFT_140796 [Stachybotrys elegans]|uniref:Uncharacterized protein n=1 Tax=Stachybotrys elegans TaxID=80388 RepID=A0A8K0SZ56_9HYPO|nr:hypothetical protein B0I35DRAFT_140796 [Stachybotrys elegans]
MNETAMPQLFALFYAKVFIASSALSPFLACWRGDKHNYEKPPQRINRTCIQDTHSANEAEKQSLLASRARAMGHGCMQKQPRGGCSPAPQPKAKAMEPSRPAADLPPASLQPVSIHPSSNLHPSSQLPLRGGNRADQDQTLSRPRALVHATRNDGSSSFSSHNSELPFSS